MLPTTPKRTTIGNGTTGLYYRDSVGYVQKLPRNLNLQFEHREGIVTNNGEDPTTRTPGYIAAFAFGYANDGDPITDNKAYSRFIGKMHGADADLGVTFGEHQSARRIMTDRLKQMVGLFRALKRGDVADALRIVRRPGGTSKPSRISKDFASTVLEWSWGWRPMVEDIGNALETLVSPVLNHRIRAASTREWSEDLDTTRYSGWAFDGWLERSFHIRQTVKYRMSLWADVAVENPNLALATRLGLVNPVGIYWAVLPFSFVVDKILNVGQVINSLTDQYGFQVTNAWTSRSVWMQQIDRETDTYYSGPYGTGSIVGHRYVYASLIGKSRRRQPGFYYPVLTTRTASIGSFSEAVSYVALLKVLLSK